MTTDDDIMDATFAALCKHGYADLTMQSIADEFGKSKSLLHYHYDSKEDLIVTFLEHLLENFLSEFDDDGDDDPLEQLLWMAEVVVEGLDDSEGPDDVQMALLGLRAQAPYDETIRAQLVTNDQHIRDRIADIVREGIEQGQFREVDPDEFAAVFRSAIEGAQSHNVILGEDAPTDVAMAGIENLLLRQLLAEGETLEGQRA